MRPLTPSGGLLILLLNGYGDGLLALPALREIARRFSNAQVYMACFSEQVDALFRPLGFKFLSVAEENNQRLPREDLKSLDVQQLVSLNAYFPCPVESELLQQLPALPRWGFCDLSGRPVSSRAIKPSAHMRDQFFQVLGWNSTYSLVDRQVFLPAEWQQKMEVLLRAWIDVKGDRLYALHLDSLQEKMWTLNNWIEIVDYIWSRWRAWPLILGEDTPDARQILECFWFASKLPSRLGIALHFAAVKSAPLFIGIDSVFAHVADSYQKPSIILFGPTDPEVWGPVSHTSSLVRADSGNEMHHVSLARVKAAAEAQFSRVF